MTAKPNRVSFTYVRDRAGDLAREELLAEGLSEETISWVVSTIGTMIVKDVSSEELKFEHVSEKLLMLLGQEPVKREDH